MVLKDQSALLKHILDEIEFILKYTKDISYDSFTKNEVLERAVVRSLEIIGEAVKQLDNDFKKQNKDIDWKKIAGFRDILIHRYFSIDWEIVWDIICNKIPYLRYKLKILIKFEKNEKKNNEKEKKS